MIDVNSLKILVSSINAIARSIPLLIKNGKKINIAINFITSSKTLVITCGNILSLAKK